MNLDSIPSTLPQTISIKNSHIHFKNGLATHCPQRGLLAEGTGPITLEHTTTTAGHTQSCTNKTPQPHTREDITQTTPVACHKKRVRSNTIHPKNKHVTCHIKEGSTQTSENVACHTEGINIQTQTIKTNRLQLNFIKFYVNKLDTLADIPIIMPIPLLLVLPPPQGNIL